MAIARMARDALHSKAPAFAPTLRCAAWPARPASIAACSRCPARPWQRHPRDLAMPDMAARCRVTRGRRASATRRPRASPRPVGTSSSGARDRGAPVSTAPAVSGACRGNIRARATRRGEERTIARNGDVIAGNARASTASANVSCSCGRSSAMRGVPGGSCRSMPAFAMSRRSRLSLRAVAPARAGMRCGDDARRARTDGARRPRQDVARQAVGHVAGHVVGPAQAWAPSPRAGRFAVAAGIAGRGHPAAARQCAAVVQVGREALRPAAAAGA